jgi:tRNA nucleotidyltransferase/poly(A) polymerase
MTIEIKLIKDALHDLTQKIGSYYCVGGFVRTYLLSLLHGDAFKYDKDIDIITEKPLAEINRILPNSFLSNRDRKTLTFIYKGVLFDAVTCEGMPVYEELPRRDFTVNAIAYKLDPGQYPFQTDNNLKELIKNGVIIDPTGGIYDIYFKVLRCVKEQNFIDDPVRLVRLFRFQAQLGFDIECNTVKWIDSNAGLIRHAAKERVLKELIELFEKPYLVKALRSMKQTVLFDELFPGLSERFDFCHIDKYHYNESVFEHSLRVITQFDEDVILRLSGFFHDLGKKDAYGEGIRSENTKGCYYGHENTSKTLFRSFCRFWGVTSKISGEAEEIIQNHMLPLDSLRVLKEKALLLRSLARFDRYIRFIDADIKATSLNLKYSDQGETFTSNAKKVRAMLSLIDSCEHLFSGKFLKKTGFIPSPAFSVIQDFLMQEALKTDFEMGEEEASVLMRRIFHYKDAYPLLVYKKQKYHRKIEHYFERTIIGVLEENIELEMQTELFHYIYVREEDFARCIDGKKSSLFFLS